MMYSARIEVCNSCLLRLKPECPKPKYFAISGVFRTSARTQHPQYFMPSVMHTHAIDAGRWMHFCAVAPGDLPNGWVPALSKTIS